MSPTQSLQVIGFSKETVPFTFVPPAKFVPGTATPTSTITVTRPTQSRGTRAQVLDVPTQSAAGITLSGELIPEVMSTLLAAWFGHGSDAVTGASGTGFTHTLTPQASLDTYSFEIDSDIYTQVLARQIVGGKISQVTLSYAAGSITTAQFSIVAQREITPTTPGLPSNPTPALPMLQPMDFSLMTFSIAGATSTQLQSATLTLDNQVQPVFSSNGELYCTRLQETQRTVTFSTTLDFLDSTVYKDWAAVAGTGGFVNSGVSLALTTAEDISGASAPYKVQYNLPTLRAQDQYQLAAASDVLNQQVAWSVTQGSADNEVNAVIVNSETSALA